MKQTYELNAIRYYYELAQVKSDPIAIKVLLEHLEESLKGMGDAKAKGITVDSFVDSIFKMACKLSQHALFEHHQHIQLNIKLKTLVLQLYIELRNRSTISILELLLFFMKNLTVLNLDSITVSLDNEFNDLSLGMINIIKAETLSDWRWIYLIDQIINLILTKNLNLNENHKLTFLKNFTQLYDSAIEQLYYKHQKEMYIIGTVYKSLTSIYLACIFKDHFDCQFSDYCFVDHFDSDFDENNKDEKCLKWYSSKIAGLIKAFKALENTSLLCRCRFLSRLDLLLDLPQKAKDKIQTLHLVLDYLQFILKCLQPQTTTNEIVALINQTIHRLSLMEMSTQYLLHFAQCWLQFILSGTFALQENNLNDFYMFINKRIYSFDDEFGMKLLLKAMEFEVDDKNRDPVKLIKRVLKYFPLVITINAKFKPLLENLVIKALTMSTPFVFIQKDMIMDETLESIDWALNLIAAKNKQHPLENLLDQNLKSLVGYLAPETPEHLRYLLNSFYYALMLKEEALLFYANKLSAFIELIRSKETPYLNHSYQLLFLMSHYQKKHDCLYELFGCIIKTYKINQHWKYENEVFSMVLQTGRLYGYLPEVLTLLKQIPSEKKMKDLYAIEHSILVELGHVSDNQILPIHTDNPYLSQLSYFLAVGELENASKIFDTLKRNLAGKKSLLDDNSKIDKHDLLFLIQMIYYHSLLILSNGKEGGLVKGISELLQGLQLLDALAQSLKGGHQKLNRESKYLIEWEVWHWLNYYYYQLALNYCFFGHYQESKFYLNKGQQMLLSDEKSYWILKWKYLETLIESKANIFKMSLPSAMEKKRMGSHVYYEWKVLLLDYSSKTKSKIEAEKEFDIPMDEKVKQKWKMILHNHRNYYLQQAFQLNASDLISYGCDELALYILSQIDKLPESICKYVSLTKKALSLKSQRSRTYFEWLIHTVLEYSQGLSAFMIWKVVDAALFLLSEIGDDNMLLSILLLEWRLGRLFKREKQLQAKQRLNEPVSIIVQTLLQEGPRPSLPTLDRWYGHTTFKSYQHDTEGNVQKVLQLLPKNYVAVVLSVDESGRYLYIFKLRKLKAQGFRVKIPDGFDNEKIKQRFQSIMESNKSSTTTIVKHTTTDHDKNKEIENGEYRSKWWKTRQKLDEECRHLWIDVERKWFGLLTYWITLNESDEANLARENILELCSHAKADVQELQEKVDVLLAFYYDEAMEKAKRKIYFNEWLQWTFGELDIGSSFVKKLEGILESCSPSLGNPFLTSSAPDPDVHYVLVVDSRCQYLPFECFPFMENMSVSRLPCLSTLGALLEQYTQPARLKQIYYILNPVGDLIHTEKLFAPILSQRSNCSGSVGKLPPGVSCSPLLIESSQVYLYFGHGTGEQYYRPRSLEVAKELQFAFLMGCSSAAMAIYDEYETFPCQYSYLLRNGVLGFIGNLWDVTDRDIDRFAHKTLQTWGLFATDNSLNDSEPNRKNETIGKAVAKGRHACLLKYIVGSAPIVYGLPCLSFS